MSASHSDPEVRRKAFERRVEMVRTVAEALAGEPVTREDVINDLREEANLEGGDPQALLDEWVHDAQHHLGREAL